MGYDVLSTDLDVIVNGNLGVNIRANEPTLQINGSNQPRLETKVLDWFQDPAEWNWSTIDGQDAQTLVPPFDLVVSADTVYTPDLSQPLLRSLRALSAPASSSRSSTSTQVYIVLERRDPELVTNFLESAERDWGFKCSRVDHSKLKRLVESKEGGLGWEDESVWEGVEIWKLKARKVVAKKGKSSATPE